MKRILVIGMTSILGGVETYIYNVIRHIDKSKFTFDFLVIGEDKSVYESEIKELLNDGNNHFYCAPNLKSNHRKAKQWLRDFYESHSYDWIYMNTSTSARIAYCIYAVKRKHTRLIMHSHNGSSSTKFGYLKNLLMKSYATLNSSVRIACSETAYKWMFTDQPTTKNIIPNGIDIKRFNFSEDNRIKIREKYGITSDKFIIGHIGRFSKQKNHNFFIELAKRLDKHFVFLLVGDGETKDSINQRITEESLQDRFIIVESKNDIECYYSAMDSFAMPSLYEGLPIVAIEAQCNGLPCVLSDKISEETNITGHCTFASIENISKWESIFNTSALKRYKEQNKILNSGYSINNTVAMIERILES